jgi:hypothetical protein
VQNTYSDEKKKKVANRNVNDRKWSLNDGQSPYVRGVRVVALGTGYNHAGEGSRRASRNGRVSSSPTRIPTSPIHNLCIAVWHTVTALIRYTAMGLAAGR